MCPCVKHPDPDPIAKPSPDASLLLGRRCCPSRLAAPVATCDGETVQYVSRELIGHVAREDEP